MDHVVRTDARICSKKSRTGGTQKAGLWFSESWYRTATEDPWAAINYSWRDDLFVRSRDPSLVQHHERYTHSSTFAIDTQEESTGRADEDGINDRPWH